MNYRGLSACLLLSLPAAGAVAVPDVMARDQMLEIAQEHLRLDWYCYSYNIYSGVPNATCPYSTPGPQTGLSYKWGGYDTRDAFWQAVVVNHGRAGDVNSAAVVSGTYGDDCSGYASRVWRSGRFATSNFANISSAVDYTRIAPGDLMNDAGSHCRLFERYTGTNLIMELECTTGVSPGRVTRRVLSTNSNYVPLRYNHVVAWPSIVRATAPGNGTAVIEFLGAATTGFRVYRSTDASNWTRVADESTLGILAQSWTASGLTGGTTYYFKVTAVNGGVESDTSAVFPVRFASGARKALLVQAFDRWTRKSQSAGKPNDFLVRYAGALAGAGYAFDTIDNLRVVDTNIALGGYGSVWWMLGDESRSDESFGHQEQIRLQNYLTAGGKLFVTGAELAYDILGAPNTINDAPFAVGYLKAGYGGDGAAGNGFAFTGVAGTPFAAVSGQFDNGTGGTYAVTYPDILTPGSGAEVVLRYPAGTGAAVLYRGTFGTGTVPGAIFVSGIPFETITSAGARQALVDAATAAFFPVSGAVDWDRY